MLKPEVVVRVSGASESALERTISRTVVCAAYDQAASFVSVELIIRIRIPAYPEAITS